MVRDGVISAPQANLPGGSAIVEQERIHIGVVTLEPRTFLREQFRSKPVSEIGAEILVNLASSDGAMIVSPQGAFQAYGAVLRLSDRAGSAVEEGARTTAARLASKYGIAIKVSSDGPISIYYDDLRV